MAPIIPKNSLECAPTIKDSDPGKRKRKCRLFKKIKSKRVKVVKIRLTFWQRLNSLRLAVLKKKHCTGRPRCGNCFPQDPPWGVRSWIEYSFAASGTAVMLVASLCLLVIWINYYHGGFTDQMQAEARFNYHPLYMNLALVFLSGFGMLSYRFLACCNRTLAKFLHIVFHSLSGPFVYFGISAAKDYHTLLNPPMEHLYSLHSWMGAITVTLYFLECLFGIVLFCLYALKRRSSKLRVKFIPVHSAIGVSVFILTIGTCITGFNRRGLENLNKYYKNHAEEGIFMNSMGVLLVMICFMIIYIIGNSKFQVCPGSEDPPGKIAKLRDAEEQLEPCNY